MWAWRGATHESFGIKHQQVMLILFHWYHLLSIYFTFALLMLFAFLPSHMLIHECVCEKCHIWSIEQWVIITLLTVL